MSKFIKLYENLMTDLARTLSESTLEEKCGGSNPCGKSEDEPSTSPCSKSLGCGKGSVTRKDPETEFKRFKKEFLVAYGRPFIGPNPFKN